MLSLFGLCSFLLFFGYFFGYFFSHSHRCWVPCHHCGCNWHPFDSIHFKVTFILLFSFFTLSKNFFFSTEFSEDLQWKYFQFSESFFSCMKSDQRRSHVSTMDYPHYQHGTYWKVDLLLLMGGLCSYFSVFTVILVELPLILL